MYLKTEQAIDIDSCRLLVWIFPVIIMATSRFMLSKWCKTRWGQVQKKLQCLSQSDSRLVREAHYLSVKKVFYLKADSTFVESHQMKSNAIVCSF